MGGGNSVRAPVSTIPLSLRANGDRIRALVLHVSRTLLVYATREGQTEKVVARIAQHLRSAGREVQIVNADDRLAIEKLDLRAFDQLVFGASMHAGGLEKELVEFVNSQSQLIRDRPRSLFVVLLSAATRNPEIRARSLADARQKIEDQLRVDFDETEFIAGALMYSKYSWPLKWLMKRIAKEAGEDTDTARDYEYTDWQQVEQYAMRLLER